MSSDSDTGVGTSQITEWRSIFTLILFVVVNFIVLFPFQIPIFIFRPVHRAFFRLLCLARVIPRRPQRDGQRKDERSTLARHFVRLNFSLNLITAPLIADLFLLAISAIGRKEVHDGTVGADNISPVDIMLFFITLAYIAISIDASGLIRYLAFKVLQWGGDSGNKLFFYLYSFFFGLGSFIGNDPIILSGTAFLAYMTRVSSNIEHPRAWIHSQFAVANIASAILVSSNPTNLVLAGAFKIKFIVYTANMIVPVFVTAIVLFPFLLYIVFMDEKLIPSKIQMHELPPEFRDKDPVNPNIPNAHGNEDTEDNERGRLRSLEEVLNPFLDKRGAAFGALVMAVTLITVLVLNAVSNASSEHPVFWVTLPAAFVMFVFDLMFGWKNRHMTRAIARKGREDIRKARQEHARELELEEDLTARADGAPFNPVLGQVDSPVGSQSSLRAKRTQSPVEMEVEKIVSHRFDSVPLSASGLQTTATNQKAPVTPQGEKTLPALGPHENRPDTDIEKNHPCKQTTLFSLVEDGYRWLQETFPTTAAVVAHLPFALVPFALSMFVLVQGLVTKGWVLVFAHGWDHWVSKTGTVGAVGGMGFLSVILCNFAGTNIGATILLCRVVLAWARIHELAGQPISNRTFWATVYGMALGVNYGAFSAAFSASLAGLLWRDILARKHIKIGRFEFARVNVSIVAISMTVGCAVMVGEVYIVRDNQPWAQGNWTEAG